MTKLEAAGPPRAPRVPHLVVHQRVLLHSRIDVAAGDAVANLYVQTQGWGRVSRLLLALRCKCSSRAAARRLLRCLFS